MKIEEIREDEDFKFAIVFTVLFFLLVFICGLLIQIVSPVPNCSVGNKATAGDYILTNSSWVTYYPAIRFCAIQDCQEYNLYWNGSSECFV